MEIMVWRLEIGHCLVAGGMFVILRPADLRVTVVCKGTFLGNLFGVRIGIMLLLIFAKVDCC